MNRRLRRGLVVSCSLGAFLAGCVGGTDTPSAPTLAVLPTVTTTHTHPVSTLPIMLPSPPESGISVSATPLASSTITPQPLALGLPGAERATLRPVEVAAALPAHQVDILPTETPAGSNIPIITVFPLEFPTATPTQAFATLVPTPAEFPTLVADLSTLAPVESALGNVNAMTDLLRVVPLFYNFDTPQIRAIADQGQALGNQSRVFTTVGDSNTLSGDFLRPLVLPDYCDWGAYRQLQDTVAYFAVATLDGTDSPFTHESTAVQLGFNSAAARDPFWATDPICIGGESPLSCELRTAHPAIVIMMLGGKDVSGMSVNAYRDNMTALTDEAIARGVIPILTTFVVLPGRDVYENSLAFNLALVDIAQSRGVPLINLWAAAATLPDYGIAADSTHLRTHPGHYCDFTGDQQRYGGTLRNLLTLQALDLLRLGILGKS